MDHNHETDALRFDRKVTSTSSAVSIMYRNK